MKVFVVAEAKEDEEGSHAQRRAGAGCRDAV